MSKVWGSLSDVSQANILEMIGGKRNANIVAALIENFDMAEDVLETSLNSQNSALRENEKVLESARGKLNQFSAAYQELAGNIFESELIKLFIDAGRTALELANSLVTLIDKLGGLSTVLGIIAAFKINSMISLVGGGLSTLNGYASVFGKKLTSLGGDISAFASIFVEEFNRVKASGQGTFKALGAGSKATEALVFNINKIAAGVTVGIAVINGAISLWEEYSRKIKEINQAKVDEAKATLDEANALQSAYAAYIKYTNATSLTASEEEKLSSSLEAVNNLLGEKASALDGITKGTQKYNEVLAAQVKEQMKIAAIEATEARDAAGKVLVQEAFGGFGNEVTSGWINTSGLSDIESESLKIVREAMYGYISASRGGDRIKLSLPNTNDPNAIIAYVYKLQKAQDDILELAQKNDEYTNTDVYDTVSDLTAKLKQSVDQYTASLFEEKSIQYFQEYDHPGTLEEFKKYRDKMIDDIGEYVGSDVSSEVVDEYLKKNESYSEWLSLVDGEHSRNQYVKNAKLIEQYRKELAKAGDAEDENTKATRKKLKELSAENEELEAVCAQYRDVTSAIDTTSEAYRNWISAQDSPQSGDVFDSALDAFKKIDDTISNVSSEDYGRIGNEAYQTAVEFVLPTGIDPADQEAVDAYIDSIDEYFTHGLDNDDNRIKTGLDIKTFCEKAVEEGLMVLDESGENFLIAGEKTFEDFAEGLNLSLPLVKAFFGEMNEFGGTFATNGAKSFDDYAYNAYKSISELRENLVSDERLKAFSEGGNVDLTLRPTVDSSSMKAAGWDIGDGIATVYSSTFSNEDGTIAMNFTPIITNSDGTVDSILTPEALEQYASEVIAGVRTDNLNLKIGATFKGEDAITQAERAGEIISELDGAYYLGDQIDFLPDLKLDMSDIDNVDDKIKALDESIQQVKDAKIDFKFDETEIQKANDIIAYCLVQKQELTAPVIMNVDASAFSGEMAEAVALLQSFVSAMNNLEIQKEIGDSLDVAGAQAEVDSLLAQLSMISESVKLKLGIDTTSVENLANSILSITSATINDASTLGEGAIKVSLDMSGVPDMIELKGRAKIYPEYINFDKVPIYGKDGTIKYTSVDKKTLVPNTPASSGLAKASGGNVVFGGRTLVGELGREIIVDPNTDRWYTVGDKGAEFVNLPKNAIVFNHKQTESLLGQGTIADRGASMASGNAALSLAGAIKTTIKGSISTIQANKPSYSQDSRNNKNSKSSNSKDDKKDPESFDWIEIAIDRVERTVKRFANVVGSTFKQLGDRLSASNSQISSIASEISLQQQAYDRYIKAANAVGLSSDLAAKVRNGAIDINKYDEDTSKLIKEYQDFYQKALDCSDAVDELKESISELYQEQFDLQAAEFDNRIALLEHASNSFNNGINNLETRGYLASAEYYKALQNTEAEKLKVQKDELSALVNAMSNAVNSGYIKEGSEAWYEMQQEINNTKEAIQESETAMIEFANSIREVQWEQFDYLQERISAITTESEFLISLMEDSKLFTDKGAFTDTGMATVGLHGQNYNILMAQADKYAEELTKINDEIANDPNNTKLLERRDELLQLQRESILAANDEKQAIVDLVEEGINIELDALRELIDTYTESLSSAKDLYDYQNRVKDQASEISTLQKQLSAYKNDTSEETRATIQKIELELANAKDELAETQYERYISDTKQLLDFMYDEYELFLSQKLDATDELIKDMIEAVNTSSSSISTTLSEKSEEVGASLSADMKNIWAEGGAGYTVMTTYGTGFNNAFTTINSVLGTISSNVAKMVGTSDKEADKNVDSTSTNTPVKHVASQPQTTPSAPTPTPQVKQISVGGKINASGAKIYDYAGDKTGENQYYSNDPIYTVLAEQNGYLQVRYHKLSKGISGWFKKSDVKAYKTGGLVDYTGLAQLDGTPSKPEMVLDSEDTKNFISLRDALRGIMNGEGSPLDVFGDGGFGMPGVHSSDIPRGLHTTNIGDITYEINIPIDHVADYNDFANQLREDGKFEKMLRSMTTDLLVGGSKMAKNKYKW